jgi:hypothetical protein
METRSKMDQEGIRGLLVINGGGAVALLALFQALLDKPGTEAFRAPVLWGLACFLLGMVAAVVHNRLARECSLEWEIADSSSPQGFSEGCPRRWIAWLSPRPEPCVCCFSQAAMWLSLGLFIVGGGVVLVGGFRTF